MAGDHLTANPSPSLLNQRHDHTSTRSAYAGFTPSAATSIAIKRAKGMDLAIPEILPTPPNHTPGPQRQQRRQRRHRQRKWHPRVFTGCLTCRKRHVKCDEQTPSCANCMRLDKVCTFSLTFVPSSGDGGSPSKANSPSALTTSDDFNVADDLFDDVDEWRESDELLSNQLTSTQLVSNANDTGDLCDDGDEWMERDQLLSSQLTSTQLVSPTNVDSGLFDDVDEWVEGEQSLSNQLASTQLISHANATGTRQLFESLLPAPVGPSRDTLYYQHFLRDVSTLLIIFDTPSNSNAYRMLPSLMGNGDSRLLRKTMEALGAMHLSRLPDTPNRILHRRAAMDLYASIVSSLRSMNSESTDAASLEMLAISLLLCMFEKMSSTDSSWKVHLLGAGQALQSIFTPSPNPPVVHRHSSTSSMQDVVPIRRFLVSLMSYLDIAASCATGEGPIIPGDYWETLGGGWQYNLGVPCFAAARGASYRALAQLRSTWSKLMSIQRDISRLAKLQRSGLDQYQRALIHDDLVCRLRSWHDSTPDVFLQLENIDGIPSDASEEQAEILTATACVQSYALACTVFLDRVVTRRVGRAAFDADIKTVVDRILTLNLNFSSGVGQLAVLWPLLTAGIATVDVGQQDLCRQKITGMKIFGFEHVSRALETLEYSWRHVRLYGGVEYETFEAMLSSNLVP